MLRRRALLLATAALLLEALPLALAHGDDHDASDMSGMPPMSEAHSQPTPATSSSDGPTSYWSLSEHVSLLFTHILLMTLAWVVLLPVGVMFSIARSRWTLLAQFVFLVANAFGLLVGVIYGHSTPDLYPNNTHSKMGWIFTWFASGWVILSVVNMYANYASRQGSIGEASHLMTAAMMARYQRLQNEELPQSQRWTDDSGQGTERNSTSIAGDTPSPSTESERTLHDLHQDYQTGHEEDEDGDDIALEKRSFLKNTKVDRFLSRTVPRFVVGRTFKALRIVYVVLERTLILQGFLTFCTGIVVLGGIGHGGAVFNVLAHFIKGGIFFWYGVLTLGRWMGMFADFGWAWNVKPPKEVVGRGRAAVPTGEFVESFVIFLYGCSNVFLEHLAAWGDEWTAQDLEHVSISVMFFGGGLLGMLIESTSIRNLLNTSLPAQHTASYADPHHVSEKLWAQPSSWCMPMNPMPGLIIMLLGLMMSGHHQESMLSTMIHKQWGTMFVGFAFARAVTYILLYLSPPTSYLPTRPPSEIITSFCLIAGGFTFMVSNKDTVAALESYGVDAMFTFILTIAMTGMVMSWALFTCAIKGWALKREQIRSSSNNNKGLHTFAASLTSQSGAVA